MNPGHNPVRCAADQRPHPIRRRQRRIFAAAVLLPLTVALTACSGGGGGSGGGGDPSPSDRPATAAEAARFLARATFGPTRAEIDALTESGYQRWFDDQLAAPPSLHLPPLEALSLPEIGNEHRRKIWWETALRAPDQLRQRVAFALSEIFVVSEQNDELLDFPNLLADYYDKLVGGALGSYRELLEQVTVHPAMGMYLSMVKNRGPQPGENLRPDENYAREVMQLFSIGLFELERDGTPRLDANGQKIPTYDQAVIAGMAHALTGWNFAYADASSLQSWLDAEPELDSMAPTEQFHDAMPKLLVGGVQDPGGKTARQDLGRVLDLLAAHPNVAPFLSRQLIQRLVTSNPSPAYVARVARVFEDDGQGRRGQLGAVVRAILTDIDARDGATMQPDRFGKLREPILKLVALTRPWDSGGTDFEIEGAEVFGQAALAAPSVFNFFRPDFSNGTLRAAGLDAPELQIITQSRIQSTANELADRMLDPELWPLDPAALAALAAEPARLVDELDLILCGGTLSQSTRNALLTYVESLELEPEPEPGWPIGTLRAREALHLIAISPDFAVQR